MGMAQRIAIAPRSLQQSRDTVLLLQGGVDATGRKAWYFVRIASPKTRAFMTAVACGHVDITQFGEIVISGYGETPPQHVIELMQTVHGYT